MSGIGCSSSQRPAGRDEDELADDRGAPGTPSRRRSCRPSSGRRGAGRLEPERVDEVPAVEREVEHVLEQLLAGRLAVAGPLGRVDVVALRRAVEQRVVARAARRRRGRTRAAAPLPPSSTRQRVPFVRLDRVRTSSRPLRADLLGAGPGAPPGRSRSSIGLHPPAVVVLPLGPDVPQVRHDLLGEELGRVARLPVRHVADVEQAEQVPMRRSLMHVLQLLAHGLGAAGDDEAAPRRGASR